MRNNHDGFTLVELLLTIIAIGVIGFAGFYVWDKSKDGSDVKSSGKTTLSESTKADLDPTRDWKSYTSTEGKFSLKYPASWHTADNPENCYTNLLLLGPTAETVGTCGSDNSGQVSISSYTVETGSSELDPQYYSDIKTTKVTVDGITGQRQTGTYTYDGEGVGSIKGSKVVEYRFKGRDINYHAYYQQQPGYPDVQKEFDLIVTKTLSFNN